MADYADLEIGIHRWDAQWYAVDLRFLGPNDDTEVRLLQQGPSLVTFDAEHLAGLADDPATYGRTLTRSVFADEPLRTAFARARDRAGDGLMRLRIFIGPSAPELHELRWETLIDPQDPSLSATNGAAAPAASAAAAAFLATNERVPFSRYLTSLNFRPVRPRVHDELRILAVISNPTDLAEWKPGGKPLPPVDVARETAILTPLTDPAVMHGQAVKLTTLASGGQASLRNVVEQLRRGDADEREGYDILYVVAHGADRMGQPVLFLEDETGAVDPVDGGVFVDRLKDLKQLPRVVILVSCQSAGAGGEARGSDTKGVLAALGPRLADAGVPAVVAMLGSVSMTTMAAFLPVFLDVLQQDGEIDVAMAAARGHVRDRFDAWMPVLFMRLRTGRVWFNKGMEGKGSEFDKWDGLLTYIENQKCTPVLGSGLVETVVGATREVARRWADTYHFPMSPYDREDLPQVAQYLAVNQGNAFPKLELTTYLKRELQRRFKKELAEEPNGPALLGPDADLDAIISAMGRRNRRGDGPSAVSEPHRVLASLPCPIYVTTNLDRLMADALAEAPAHGAPSTKKSPAIGVFGWSDDLEPDNSVFATDPNFRPDKNHPLVYHLHGRLDDPSQIVLKEDDYLDYLIGVTGNRKNIPPVVRRALTDSSLLLIGYRMDDWDFRVLFRSIWSQPGSNRRLNYKHVAVQIDLQTDRIVEPDLARRYLERYFQGADVTIYWGSAEAFLSDLQEKWQKRLERVVLA